MTSLAPLLRFLNDSPTPFHVVANVAARLHAAGYTAVDEGAAWSPPPSGKFYFTRNGSSLVAVNLNAAAAEHGFRLVGAHTDSPCLKVKPTAIACNHGYAKLAVEVYGGALLNPWFDRDLGLAGRVTVQTARGAQANCLLNINRPIAFIPSLAIHLDRQANDHRAINQQQHLPALLCRVAKTADAAADTAAPILAEILMAELARQRHDLEITQILAHELSLYDCQPAQPVGLHNEFIAAARLDNLLSCYAGMQALVAAGARAPQRNSPPPANHVLALNDHEEIGSASAAGAAGPFLQAVLQRLCGDPICLTRALRHSMLISADNAHGVHPNYPTLHEPNHQPLMNAGPVIKVNSNQRYATNSETAALFRRVCARHNLPVQTIVVRSDMACGSTIGPITATKLGVRTLDIGVPQLGMHSIRELAGAQDQHTLSAALQGFYELPDWPF